MLITLWTTRYNYVDKVFITLLYAGLVHTLSTGYQHAVRLSSSKKSLK